MVLLSDVRWKVLNIIHIRLLLSLSYLDILVFHAVKPIRVLFANVNCGLFRQLFDLVDLRLLGRRVYLREFSILLYDVFTTLHGCLLNTAWFFRLWHLLTANSVVVGKCWLAN